MHNPENNPLTLSSSLRFVTGAKRAAIYDLEKGQVFSLNESARQIVEGSPDNFGFWSQLEGMGLTGGKSEAATEAGEVPPVVGLEFMWLELTSKCNLRCLHCYAEAENPHAPAEVELNTKSWQRIIEEGAKIGCRKLQFIGGEPFLDKGLFDLAVCAKDLGYEFMEIFTNGTLLTEAKIKRIKDLGINIAVSVYSNRSEIHEAVTGIKGSFSKIYRGLTMLKEAEIPTRVAVIVMRQNQETVEETLNFLDQIGLTSRPDIVRPTGRGSCPTVIPDAEVVKEWGLMVGPNFSTSREEFFRNQHWNSCWAGKIAVTSKGEVIPCIFGRNHVAADLSQGIALQEAVFGENLQKLWKITKDQIETCGGCEYRHACSDCRPLAEATTGNLYAKNPRCIYNPIKGEWLES